MTLLRICLFDNWCYAFNPACLTRKHYFKILRFIVRAHVQKMTFPEHFFLKGQTESLWVQSHLSTMTVDPMTLFLIRCKETAFQCAQITLLDTRLRQT